MGKKASTVAGRAWRLLRLPLHWSKKSSESKLRSPGDSHVLKTKTFRRHYSEREFSFDDTPSYQFKATRRSASLCLLPCITPTVDFDDDDDDDDENFFQKSDNMKCLKREESDEDRGAHMVDEDEGSVWEGADETHSEIQFSPAKFSKSTTAPKSDEHREEDWDSQTSWSDAMPEMEEEEEDEEIDSRAEKFISEFYEKIRLQRQSSPLGRAS